LLDFLGTFVTFTVSLAHINQLPLLRVQSDIENSS